MLSPPLPTTSVSCSVVELERGAELSEIGSDTVLPHESQNRAPVLSSVFQEGQVTVRRVPHASQNLASSRLSFPQFEQLMCPLSDMYFGRYLGSIVRNILGEMADHHNMVSDATLQSLSQGFPSFDNRIDDELDNTI